MREPVLNTESLNIVFDPYFSPWIILFVTLIGLSLLAYKIFIHKLRRGAFPRGCALLFFALILFNPLILEQEKKKKDDVVVIIEDASSSNKINDREDQTQAIKQQVLSELEKLKNIQIRQIRITSEQNNATEIFDAWKEALSDIPYEQVGATLLISDGIVHDAPEQNLELLERAGPFHTILTGHADEKDRLVKIHNAPTYGLVNESIAIEIEIKDIDTPLSPLAPVQIQINNETVYDVALPPNEKREFSIDIPRSGLNIIQISTPFLEGEEITPFNNKTIIPINGVRDRLKVLLVSGLPHNGERLWRNILKSDANIDLVHFTILRSPDKMDNVPDNELALIPFPIDELFMRKINDFDLIIFDRFARFGTIPQNYIDNIGNFIEQGGAFLDVLGPNVVGNSPFKTKLDTALPASTSGQMLEGEFFPQVSEVGTRHPVTQNLFSQQQNRIFPWYRQMRLDVEKGHVIMEGLSKEPLLVVSDIGKGRVAQMASDQIWLWARGHKAQKEDDISNTAVGPYLPLLRRLSHWLMKEPELETERIVTSVSGYKIHAQVYSLETGTQTLTLQRPDGLIENREIEIDNSGVATLSIDAEDFGVYHLSNEKTSAIAIVGSLNDKEYQNMISTNEWMHPIADSTNGEIIRLRNASDLQIRKTTSRTSLGGRNWLGIQDRGRYDIISSKQSSLIFPLLGLLLLPLLLIWGWYRENK